MAAEPLPRVASEIKAITAVLAQSSLAIPVIIGTITSVIAIIKALGGTAPPLADILTDLERQIALNKQRGEAEIARLKALADQQPQH